MMKNLVLAIIIILIAACSNQDDTPKNVGGRNSHITPATTAATINNSKRFALLIGNADYQHAPSLDNPVNDAVDMATVLKSLGFQVIVKRNADKKTMVKAAQAFGTRLSQGGVGLFYFSGHGLQSKNRNYLVPTDANINSEADIEFEGFDANRVLAQMGQANNGLNMMILDACRDNPYQTTTLKSLKKGLAKMDSPPRTLIAYATAPNLASYGDSKQRNSIYTTYLLAALRDNRQVSMSVLDMLTGVAKKVVTRTQNKQVPWKSDSLLERFCFGKCGSGDFEPQRAELEKKIAQLERENARQKEEARRAEQARLAEQFRQREETEKRERLIARRKEEARRAEQARLAEQSHQREETEKRERLVKRLLTQCEKHFKANRLTTGRSGTALACYKKVLKKDSTNAKALAGLKNIEARYVKWAKQALDKEQRNKAKRYLASLRKVNPDSSKLAEFEARLSTLSSSNRYTDNGNGTVKDNKTGLIWLKNANCFGEQDWYEAKKSAANLASGQCGLRDGSRRGKWRLPTKDEWKAMVDKRYEYPALSNAAGTGKWTEGDAFSGVKRWYYWSSSSYAGGPDRAWSVGLRYGNVDNDGKTDTDDVWPVRGGH